MYNVQELRRVLKSRGACLLAHNYQRPEVQDAADFVGDSLELSLKALESDARVVVFAGVDFMAEQAAILNPEKTVIHPEPLSVCPMAAMLTVDIVREYKEKYPGSPFVVYVNSSASVKALADYVVTSANAVKLVSQLDAEPVLFGPDRHLAEYVGEKTCKEVVPVPDFGHCPVHAVILRGDLVEAKKKYPDAKVLAHPECSSEVRKLADFVGSTSQMIKAAVELGSNEYIIATEVGMLHRLGKLGLRAYPASSYAVCVNMKMITLDSVVESLSSGKGAVKVDPKIAAKAKEAIVRSFELLGVEGPWSKS